MHKEKWKTHKHRQQNIIRWKCTSADSKTKAQAEIRDRGITEHRKTERDREMERGINQCFSLVRLSVGCVAE